MKPRHMLTWMLWSAAAALSHPGHAQMLDLAHHGFAWVSGLAGALAVRARDC